MTTGTGVPTGTPTHPLLLLMRGTWHVIVEWWTWERAFEAMVPSSATPNG